MVERRCSVNVIATNTQPATVEKISSVAQQQRKNNALDFTLDDVAELDPTPSPTRPDRHNDLLSFALDYAGTGIAVVPLHEPLFDAAGHLTGCTCEAWKRSKGYERWLKAKQSEGKC